MSDEEDGGQARPEASGKKVQLRKVVADKVRQLNSEGILRQELRLAGVAEVLASLETEAALDVLATLESQAADVENPTAWVCEIVSGSAGFANEGQSQDWSKFGIGAEALPGVVPPPRKRLYSEMEDPSASAPSAATSTPRNYKTIACRHFARGYCQMGENCNFAHGEVEFRFAEQASGGKGKGAASSWSQKGSGGGKGWGSSWGSSRQSIAGVVPPALQVGGALFNPQAQQQQSYTNPAKYKTQMCKHFERGGTCPKGEACMFAHGEHELQAPGESLPPKVEVAAQVDIAASLPQAERQAQELVGSMNLSNMNLGKFKTELCRHWQRTGTCRMGDVCKFAHGEQELMPAEIPKQDPAKFKTRLCKHWQQGTCTLGDRCSFAHGEAELVAKGGPMASAGGVAADPAAAAFFGAAAAAGFEASALEAAAGWQDPWTATMMTPGMDIGINAFVQAPEAKRRRVDCGGPEQVELHQGGGAPKFIPPGGVNGMGVAPPGMEGIMIGGSWQSGLEAATGAWNNWGNGGATAEAGNPRKFKTQQCRHFARGYCQLGESCNFLHGVEQAAGAAGAQGPLY